MGSNRGRKAGGSSKDFGAGLKYSSRQEDRCGGPHSSGLSVL
ncbi:St14 [Phodopus roborovskii]|uniref:St14 protein n=1 Tax=Phodopus roborovskii TaxID=109678 RepID=A0AAU9ZU28_PHORO|nr:St14 [Phodopus roborovskii]